MLQLSALALPRLGGSYSRVVKQPFIATVLVTSRCSFTHQQAHRFSTTRSSMFKEFFPAPDSPQIRITRSAWEHPIYTDEQMNSVRVAHREAKDTGDRIALTMVRILRWGLDLATGYRHQDPTMRATDGKPQFAMTERKYLIRNVFLESVAGVPGMVGGMLRHLHSMRRMKRDNGWIETLLEESYNERMHLLIFMKASTTLM